MLERTGGGGSRAPRELESGNPAKGLAAGLGRLSGEVRLVIDSDVPVVPSAYVRNADGTLSGDERHGA